MRIRYRSRTGLYLVVHNSRTQGILTGVHRVPRCLEPDEGLRGHDQTLGTSYSMASRLRGRLRTMHSTPSARLRVYIPCEGVNRPASYHAISYLAWPGQLDALEAKRETCYRCLHTTYCRTRFRRNRSPRTTLFIPAVHSPSSKTHGLRAVNFSQLRYARLHAE